jgi:hypothetical protein
VAEPAEPYKEFIREMTLRIERVMREFSREMRTMHEENGRRFDRVDAQLRDQREEFRDLREESRAQTQALLRVIDRLDNGGGAAATS